jgi:S1-C subfamily serine protease
MPLILRSTALLSFLLVGWNIAPPGNPVYPAVSQRLAVGAMVIVTSPSWAVPVAAVPQAVSPPDAKKLRKQAEQAIAAGNSLDALRFLEACVAAKPNEKACQSLLTATRTKARAELFADYERLPDEDLLGRRALVSQILLAVDRNSTNARAILESIDAKLKDISAKADTYLDELHHSDVFVPIPASLTPYLRYLPNLKRVQSEATVHAAIAEARAKTAAGAYEGAATMLAPYKQDADAGAALEFTKRAAVTSLTQSTDGTAVPRDLSALLDTLGRVRALETLIGTGQADLFRMRLGDQAVALAKRRLPGSAGAPAPLSARVVSEKLPGLAAFPAFPWERLGIGPTGIFYSVGVTNTNGSCPSGIVQQRLADAIRSVVRWPLTYSETLSAGDSPASSKGRLTFELSDLTCEIHTGTKDLGPVNSTYIASYQQVTNPDYVQAQSRLAALQADLNRIKVTNAINPGTGWAAVAGATAELTAQLNVNRAVATLQKIPPFLAVPVKLPYTAYRYRDVKVATATGTLSLSDAMTGFADALPVEVSASFDGEGLRGVMERDAGDLRNSAPSLPDDQHALAEAVAKLASQSQTVARQCGERAFVQRALAEKPGPARALVVAGNLLIARDFGAQPSRLEVFDSIYRQISDVTLESMPSIKLEPSLFSVAAPSPRSPNVEAKRLVAKDARTAMLERSLQSIVTVQVGQALGSGFFVGPDGLVLTNAHVVEGGARIVVRTSGGDTYLAVVAKIASAADLALLKVTGGSRPGLPIGDSDAIDVGNDVIAVGSPLGLQGTVTRGIVSAIRQTPVGRVIQTDAAINAGNSGGPLLTEDGKVVGINTFKVKLENVESLGFAIAINEAKKVFAPLLK